MKRVLLLSLLVLSTLIVFAQTAMATDFYLSGNYRTSAYGAKANVQLPSAEPILYDGLIAAWVGTTNFGNESWAETGWNKIYGEAPWSFAEYVFYGDRTLYTGSYLNYGDNSAYRIEYSTDGYWKTYINDQYMGAWSGGGLPTPPTQMQGTAEVQGSSSNQLWAIFSNVQWKNSSGTWNYFDQNHLFSLPPYYVAYSTYYYYLCYGNY
jgi:hypothetical protein